MPNQLGKKGVLKKMLEEADFLESATDSYRLSKGDKYALNKLEEYWIAGNYTLKGYDIALMYKTILENPGLGGEEVDANKEYQRSISTGSNCSIVLMNELGITIDKNGEVISKLPFVEEDPPKEPEDKYPPPEMFVNDLKGVVTNFREYFVIHHSEFFERLKVGKKKNWIYERGRSSPLPGMDEPETREETNFRLNKIIEVPEKEKEALKDDPRLRKEVKKNVLQRASEFNQLKELEEIADLWSEDALPSTGDFFVRSFYFHLEWAWKKVSKKDVEKIENKYKSLYEKYLTEKSEEEARRRELNEMEKIIIDEKWSKTRQEINMRRRYYWWSDREAWTLNQLFSPHRIIKVVTERRKGERRSGESFRPGGRRLDDVHRKGNTKNLNGRRWPIDNSHGQWKIGALKSSVFVPWRTGMYNIRNTWKIEDEKSKKVGNYNLPRTEYGTWDNGLPLPCEIVFQLHELPCIIDFWLVLDKPEPSKPYGTITFDSPEDLLSIDEIDLVLTQTISTKELMEFFARDVELMPLARNELPEMMRDYYSV
tara:strand:+ start:469 stop:2088 length:1620 start_codon:yes stop_codon:yes gene_type:complete